MRARRGRGRADEAVLTVTHPPLLITISKKVPGGPRMRLRAASAEVTCRRVWGLGFGVWGLGFGV